MNYALLAIPCTLGLLTGILVMLDFGSALGSPVSLDYYAAAPSSSTAPSAPARSSM